MSIVNLTPHEISIVHPDGGVTTLPPSGKVARVGSIVEPDGHFDGVPLFTTTYGGVSYLPDPQEGVIFVVSQQTCAACPGRGDLYHPASLIRNDAGQIIGCNGLSRPKGA